jgi:NDP-sugar pyrophosphorylase family protein
MKAMILAAGLGTRLKPLTDSIPKALLPLGGKTLLQWQIEKLKSVGITDIVLNVHHFPEQIIEYLQQNNNFGCNIQISDETEQLLETGGGLRKARALFGDATAADGILVCNVDILSNVDLQTLLAAYNPEEIGVVVVSERQTQRYLLFDENNILCGWTNIATGELRGPIADSQSPIANRPLAFSGMQVLNPRIFDCMDEVVAMKGDKFSLIDLYVTISKSETLRAFIPEDYRMMDVGKIDQLSEAEEFARTFS